MKLKSISADEYYKEFDINGNIIISNEYPGDSIKYFYDKNNRLIKRIVTEDYGCDKFVYAHNYEYNNFGYRISVFKIKKILDITTFSDDPTKIKTEDCYEPITTIDVKIIDGKETSKTITNFITKTVKTEEVYEPIEIKDSLKYDEDNRIIERISEENHEDGEVTITEYHYTFAHLDHALGGSSKHKKVIALTFMTYKSEGILTEDTFFLLECISVTIFDEEDNVINRVFQKGIYQHTTIKRFINSNKKYNTKGEVISIDSTLDNIKKSIKLYEYQNLYKGKRMLVSETELSIIDDTISVIGKEHFEYFDE